MRVLIVHNRRRSSMPSGEDRVVDQESAALASAGHEVRRFERCSDDIEGYSLVRKAMVPVEAVWSRGSAAAARAVLAEFRPDVVHVHNVFPLLSPSVLTACRDLRVPAVVTIHNYRQICPSGNLFRADAVCRDCVGHVPWPAVRHGCYRGSVAASVPLAVANVAQVRTWKRLPSAYIFISEAQQHEFEPLGLPESRCFVKLNLVPPMEAKTAAEDLVVYIGRVSHDKGVPLLMRGWDAFLALEGNASLRLAIAGSGPLDAMVRDWAESRPSVEVLGLQTREECAALLRRARATVVPSMWLETFGLVVVEAMAAAVAPIASAHGSLPELITDGVDGVLFPPGDHRALAAVLARAASDPDGFEDLGKAALRTYHERFDASANLRHLEAIYRFAVDHPVWAGGLPPSARVEPAGTTPDSAG